MVEEAINILFICSKNQWRSPTAEKIYTGQPLISVRSAGTASSARRKVSAKDIDWADLVMVMEYKHSTRLRSDFPEQMKNKECHVLGIPDEYRFMDPELVSEIQSSADSIIRIATDQN